MILLEKNCKVCEAKDLEIDDYILTDSGYKKITSIRSNGRDNCYDISLLKDNDLFLDEPNFVLGNGIISHNCQLSTIAECVDLVRLTRGEEIKKDDIPINDRNSIFFGSKRDLMGIFQFEHPSTKSIIDAVGMESLTEAAIITSLLRPGPRDMGMDMEFARRKKGEPYEEIQAVKELLKNSHGIMVFQESLILIAKEIAGFTIVEANKLRKTVGKKKKEEMEAMKSKFIDGCARVGKITTEEAETLWLKILAFARYGFCLSWDTTVQTLDGIKRLDELKIGDKVKIPDFYGSNKYANIYDIVDQGEKELFEITFFVNSLQKESKIKCTLDHKFICSNGNIHAPISLSEIIENKYALIYENNDGVNYFANITNVKSLGIQKVGDISIDSKDHIFLANGIAAKNCAAHAYAYSAISCIELYLKYHYELEYCTAMLNSTHLGKKKFGEDQLITYINYCRKINIDVLVPDINMSNEKFSPEGDRAIRFGLSQIKQVANSAEAIIKNQPYKDMADFYERAQEVIVDEEDKTSKTRKVNKRVVEFLIAAGCFDKWGKRNDMLVEYYKVRKNKKDVVPVWSEKEQREKEEEAIGLVLSEEPLRKKYRQQIKDNKWHTIDDANSDKERIKVFGKIQSAISKRSSKGNQMLVVNLVDGVDNLKFYVFENGLIRWDQEYNVGDICVVPLSKFKDGNARFFDMNKDGQMIKKFNEP